MNATVNHPHAKQLTHYVVEADLARELDALRRRVALLEQRAAEAMDFAEDKFDVNDSDYGPVPNDWMRIYSILDGGP